MFRKITKKIDSILLKILGVDRSIKPTSEYVRLVDGKSLYITFREPYKRHLLTINWNNINNSDIENLGIINKKQLGSAIGKSLGNGITVSFEKMEVKE